MEKNEMMFKSTSGFCMPFLIGENEELQILLPYGEQINPQTDAPFFHQGIDFVCQDKPLYATATGIVTGVGSDPVHENYITVKHGDYEIKYGHLKEYYAGYGTHVRAGQKIAHSGDFLHLGVRFRGEYLNPDELLNTILENIHLLSTMGMVADIGNNGLEGKVHTKYDKDQDEIGRLLMEYLPQYFSDMDSRAYATSPQFVQFLRSIFPQGTQKGYFFEDIPSMNNPLGMGSRSIPFVSKVQETILADFLRYLGVHKNIFPSSMGESEKKNFLTKQQLTD